MQPISPDEFYRRMLEIVKGCTINHHTPFIRCSIEHMEDVEHSEADELMTSTLESLGYGKGIAIFNAMCKWYS